MAPEEDLQIADAAMVDVGIGTAQSPIPGIGGKIGTHVLMDKLLQIAPKGIAVGADHHIGAYAAVARNIAVRIGHPDIGC